MAFEYNEGALELEMIPKLRPRTKNIYSKYHHFRSHVCTGKITVLPIPTKEQTAAMASIAAAGNNIYFCT